jgi:hypothetical protein
MMRRFIRLGADVNYMASQSGAGGRQRHTTPLLIAVHRGHEAAVRELLNHGVDIDKTEPANKMTAVHVAAQAGNVPLMKILLSSGAKHDAPLHQAIVFLNKEDVICLLDHGADVNLGDDRCFTALNFAAQQNLYEIAKILVKRGADINLADHYEYTPLHTAAIRGHNKIVEYLMKMGADFDAQGNAVTRACRCCGKSGVPLELCSGCRVAWYCGTVCQKKDWVEGGETKHKLQCSRIKEQRELYKEKKKEEAREIKERHKEDMMTETMREMQIRGVVWSGDEVQGE